MAHLSATLNVMITAAREAGKSLRRDFYEVEALQVSRKGAADFVSAADLRAEEIIYQSLSRSRPKFGFLMEERGEVEGSDNSNRFIVDPLDGTTNFLHSLPHCSVSIGLERDRQPYAGVVYNPITDDLFYAEKGEGAYHNDTRIRVSNKKDLTECLFGCGLPYKGKLNCGPVLDEIDRVTKETAGARRMGSAALDLAYVAKGRFDAYWERGINAWDVTAGIVLVREAGGMVCHLDGTDDKPHLTGSVLATNGELQDVARKIILGR
ncbi:inositol monophosphatase family protein [Aquisalinus flavus]|uniref:Inositol-1-monophosphatase n=1 Tax=Aquisalinus flavus TaxID=1526572 RepID=A0A8J2V6T3_9PROT|nr:inositol monophosphatase family protein [Aquisalinus flavus]MBD0426836.1 inositol monophosphatase [Aquisalinus flavus]UNE46684.1 inositol monophosphatase [Aquisalinus flavus]GGC96379.1 inositol monophosphatase [Aquisalinus flavus]